MEHYDVVIVGAGLAGLQCARLLGERGFHVLLADRKKSLALSKTSLYLNIAWVLRSVM
jgi:flavin-dependent dehydrogenase